MAQAFEDLPAADAEAGLFRLGRYLPAAVAPPAGGFLEAERKSGVGRGAFPAVSRIGCRAPVNGRDYEEVSEARSPRAGDRPVALQGLERSQGDRPLEGRPDHFFPPCLLE